MLIVSPLLLLISLLLPEEEKMQQSRSQTACYNIMMADAVFSPLAKDQQSLAPFIGSDGLDKRGEDGRNPLPVVGETA